MPRLTYPALRQKFERLLREYLQVDEPMLSPKILTLANDNAGNLNMNESELAFLSNNLHNQLRKAEREGIIVSAGKKRGYRLSKDIDEIFPKDETQSDKKKKNKPSKAKSQKTEEPWESLLHLPISIALAKELDCLVCSLPTTTGKTLWGNPDILFIRSTPSRNLFEHDKDLDLEIFKRVDDTPELILASAEIKYLSARRSDFFQAIAECAANSRWANETWLIFARDENKGEPVEEDILSLARSSEVGLFEIFVDPEDVDEPELLIKVHHEAPTRTSLRLKGMAQHQQTSKKLLEIAQRLIRDWDDAPDSVQEGFQTEKFFDLAEESTGKAVILMHQALANLKLQRGFSSASDFSTSLENLRKNDEKLINKWIEASVRSCCDTASCDPTGKTLKGLIKMLGTASKAGLLQSKLDEFTQYLNLLPTPSK